MYTYKSRAFLLKNHLKTVLGNTRYQSLTIHGRQWNWLEAGSIHASETVVLLHGMAMSKNRWRVVMPILAKYFRVIVPDIPGFKIGTAAANPVQGFEGLAKELTSFLDVVIDRPIHLVGHSMAATLSTGLALRMAVPVKSLTLVSLAEARFSDDLIKTLRVKSMTEFVRDYTEKSHLTYVRAMFYRTTAGVELMARNSWRLIKDSIHSIAQLSNAMEAEMSFLEEYYQSLSVPTLVINGQQDLWRDITRDARCFSGPNVKRLELDECRHLPFIEQPIQFSDALMQFLLSGKTVKVVA